MNSVNTISEQEAAANGIVTDRQRLLRSRHWAQRLQLFSVRAASSAMLGNVRSRFRGRGMEFEEVRRYQPGDDIRTIDWKVTARSDSTYTKLFREERERPCHILVDQRSSMFFGSTERFKSVLAAELAVAIGWAAVAAGDRVGAQIIGSNTEVDIRARNSRRAALALINSTHTLNTQLLTTEPGLVTAASRSLSHCLTETQRIIRPGTAVFVVSDFHDIDADCIKTLSKMGKHADITLVSITDPIEQSLPTQGRLPISDGFEVANVRLSKHVKQAYQETLNTRASLIQQASAQSKSHQLNVSTESTARTILSQVYRA